MGDLKYEKNVACCLPPAGAAAQVCGEESPTFTTTKSKVAETFFLPFRVSPLEVRHIVTLSRVIA